MQRLARIAAVVGVVVLGCTSLADVSGATTPKPSPTCATLAEGAVGPAVATVQALVKTTPDGDFGPMTKAAVSAWQKKKKLAVTGAVDAATWAALPVGVARKACAQQVHGTGVAVTCAALQQGAVGPAVAVLQKAVTAGVDGQFGAQTDAALRAAQQKAGLTQTGVTDAATWAALGLTGTPACVVSASPPAPKPKHPKDWKAQRRVRALTAVLAAKLADEPVTPGDPVAMKALRFARRQTGKPYVWGGTGPKGYDCSGLTMTSYQHAGITIPRVANDQYAAGPLVPLDQARQGDLLFYASDVVAPRSIYHVVIYVGGGQILDAPYTGAYVGTRQLWTQDLLPVALRPTAQLVLPVKPGATGWTVSQLQQELDRHGAHLTVDGGYGAASVTAVRHWQARHKLPATGVVDQATWLTFH